MNVLSLFDGMSCGQIAFERAKVSVYKYFASETDKHAIKTSKHHYPNTIHLGDVKNVKGNSLGWIDYLIGGSPCQGFSRAGDGLGFDDPRSVLFFEYVRILNEVREVNPDVEFLLENVEMGKENEDVITRILKVRPIRLCSSMVSAQSRPRLYWTNIPVNSLPNKKVVRLKDILEEKVDEKYIQSEKWHEWWAKNFKKQIEKGYSTVNADKANCLTARMYSCWNGNFVIHQLNPSKESGGKQPYQQNRVYGINGLSPALLAQMPGGSHTICAYDNIGNVLLRRLTVNECCRLQTVPDNYFKDVVSDSQAYKMLGNGWTVDIISHILKHSKNKQLCTTL